MCWLVHHHLVDGADRVDALFATSESAEAFAVSEHDRTHDDYTVEGQP